MVPKSPKRIFIPWNLDENHWTIIIYDSNRKIIEYFDSKGDKLDSDELKAITKCLKVRLWRYIDFSNYYFEINFILYF